MSNAGDRGAASRPSGGSRNVHRRPFYNVPISAYILLSSERNEKAKQEPEEAVRQWCSFELIRAYGISISELSFEAPVKVGSKSYWIDILVSRNGVPWIVVECKAAGKGCANGIEQAISYADSPRIQAEYVLCTDGNDWVAKRRYKGSWLAVLDIPRTRFENNEAIEITHFFACFEELAPLLYKLDESVGGIEAKCFLSSLQEFFRGRNLVTDGVDLNLCLAADNLVRVLTCDQQDSHYRFGKYEVARQALRRFQAAKSFNFETGPLAPGMRVEQGFGELQMTISQILGNSSETGNADALLLRHLSSLLDYGGQLERNNGKFPVIPTSVHHSLRDFLQLQLLMKFDALLPDPVGQLSSDFKLYCSRQWQENLKAAESP